MRAFAGHVRLGRRAARGLCAACLPGGATGRPDLRGAVAEAARFGLASPMATTALTSGMQLGRLWAMVRPALCGARP